MFHVGYSSALTDHVNEEYVYGAPLPYCTVPGCIEECHSVKTIVYNMCLHHKELYDKGISVDSVCQHPCCNVDIIDSPKKFCVDHGVN